MNVASPTDAQGDIFPELRGRLERAHAGVPAPAPPVRPTLGPGRLSLDYVSRPEAFVRLYPKVLHGAMLDALEHLGTKPASETELVAFATAAETSDRRPEPSVSLGDYIRFESERLIGSGLELDGELLQLSAFSRHRLLSDVQATKGTSCNTVIERPFASLGSPAGEPAGRVPGGTSRLRSGRRAPSRKVRTVENSTAPVHA